MFSSKHPDLASQDCDLKTSNIVIPLLSSLFLFSEPGGGALVDTCGCGKSSPPSSKTLSF